MSVTARVRLVAGASLAFAAAVCGWTGFGHVHWWAAPAVALTIAGTETAVVHLAFGRQRWTFSLSEAAIGAAIVLQPGAWVVTGVTVGVLCAQLVRRQPMLKLTFNVAGFAAATAGAVGMAHSVGGGVAGGVAGMGVFWLVNNVLIAAVVSITSRQRMLDLLWASAPLAAVHSAGTSSLGLLGAWLSLHAPLGLLALVVPLLLLWLSYDEQTARAAEARLFAELAQGQQQASARSIDVSAQVVLTAAARLFGGADVEMVLLDPEGPVLHVGDETGVVRRRVDPEAFSSPWVLRALGSGAVRTGTDDGRPYCSAVLGSSDAPLAVLIARRAAGSPAFGRREAMLAEVLVRQAESWLSVAELTRSRDVALAQAEAAEGAARALGDIGADTGRALVVLRESAARLTRLATAPAGADPVGEIVEELHAVERAVASLLGAIALAAEPGLDRELSSVDGGAVPAGRSADDWTTTGVLDVDAPVVSLLALPGPPGTAG